MHTAILSDGSPVEDETSGLGVSCSFLMIVWSSSDRNISNSEQPNTQIYIYETLSSSPPRLHPPMLPVASYGGEAAASMVSEFAFL